MKQLVSLVKGVALFVVVFIVLLWLDAAVPVIVVGGLALVGLYFLVNRNSG
jgi:hypothetical protein